MSIDDDQRVPLAKRPPPTSSFSWAASLPSWVWLVLAVAVVYWTHRAWRALRLRGKVGKYKMSVNLTPSVFASSDIAAVEGSKTDPSHRDGADVVHVWLLSHVRAVRNGDEPGTSIPLVPPPIDLLLTH